MENLPVELVGAIIHQLDGDLQSLKQFRLVSRALSTIPNSYLFDEVAVWHLTESLQKLVNISERDHLRIHVKKLIIFPELLSPVREEQFKDFYTSIDMINQIDKYWKMYNNFARDQRELQTSGRHMLYLRKAFAKLPNLQSLAFTDAEDFCPNMNAWGPVSSTREEWTVLWKTYKMSRRFPLYGMRAWLEASSSCPRKVETLLLDRLKHDIEGPSYDLRPREADSCLSEIKDVEIVIHAMVQQIEHLTKFLIRLPQLERLSMFSSSTRWNEPKSFPIVPFGSKLYLPNLVEISMSAFELNCCPFYKFLERHSTIKRIYLNRMILYTHSFREVFNPMREILILEDFRFNGSIEASPASAEESEAVLDIPRGGPYEGVIIDYVLGRCTSQTWNMFMTELEKRALRDREKEVFEPGSPR